MRFLAKPILLFFLSIFLFSACSKKESEPFKNLLGPDSVAETQNMDGELLRDMLLKIRDGEFGAIRSVLVVRNNEIVVEEYFRGYSSTRLHSIYSITKSVTSVLAGIAIDQGHLTGIDQKVMPFFEEDYHALENQSSLKDSMTIGNLLTMTSGLQWDWEEDELNFGPNPDWIRDVLELPMMDAPGASFNYNSASALLLSVILQKATGRSTAEYARQNLFIPIGTLHWNWFAGSRSGFPNYNDTSGGLQLRPRSLANIGLLMLENGKRGDTQVVSREWVEESTRTHLRAGETTEYGYWWWRFSGNSPVVRDLRVNDLFFGWGALGQFLIVVPHLNMVVVSNADNFENTGAIFFTALRDYIFASVQDK